MGVLLRCKQTKEDKVLAEYIKHRVGEDVSKDSSKEMTFREKLKYLNISKLKELFIYKYSSFVSLFLPKAVRENLFLRTSVGERHIWMYDRYSLGERMKKAGFEYIRFFEHNESQIPNFEFYYLDTNKDGSSYKGVSSIYCEGRKE
jgi:hypothetical protein